MPSFVAFAQWWRGELAALVPAPIRDRVSRHPAIDCAMLADGRVLVGSHERRCSLSAAAGGDAAEPGTALFVERLEALLARPRTARTVRLTVPRSACLMRSVELPRAALVHAGPILRHEIEGLLHASADEILTDWYVETEDPASGQLFLRQVVLLRARIAPVERVLESVGARLVRITVGDLEDRPVPVDLLNERRASPWQRFRALPVAAQGLHLLAAMLLAGAVVTAADRPAATLRALEELRASHPRPTAADISAGTVATFLAEDVATTSGLLDEVAARLPADAFLRSFSRAGRAVRIAVAGPGSAAAADALRASPLVTSVETAEETAMEIVLRLQIAASPAGGAAIGGGA